MRSTCTFGSVSHWKRSTFVSNNFWLDVYPLPEPLIEEECEDTIGLKLLTKARYSLARFKGKQIVIFSSRRPGSEVESTFQIRLTALKKETTERVLLQNAPKRKCSMHATFCMQHLGHMSFFHFFLFDFENNFPNPSLQIIFPNSSFSNNFISSIFHP